MKNRKRVVSVIAAVMAAVMLIGLVIGLLPKSASAAEQSSSEIKNQIEQLEKEKNQIDSQISSLESQLSDNLSEMQAIVKQKDIIDQEIFMLHEKVENINKQVMAYGQLIADKQDELDKAETDLAEMRERHKERLRALEEGGDMTYWSVIFEAEDFSDLLDRFAMAQELKEADEKRIEEMSKIAQEVAGAKAELETEKAALEDIKNELNKSEAELEKKREDADNLLADLLATGKEYEDYLHQAELKMEELLGEISQKEDEYDEAKDREYQQWLSTSIPPTTARPSYSGGGVGGNSNIDASGISWVVPCSYRYPPISGAYSFHNGVDLAGRSGTPIYATRGGRVARATYDYAAGYYVTIDHLDGFESKYLHMTHYVVSVGDYVNAGQVIGYMGSTGSSTGPHLHFTVCYNGSPVNPANYISFG